MTGFLSRYMFGWDSEPEIITSGDSPRNQQFENSPYGNHNESFIG